MHDKPKPKQVSLAGVAAGNMTAKKVGSKKRVWWIVLPIVLVVVLVVVLLASSSKQKGPTLSARETISYTVTSDEMASKVSYFALGVLGAKSTDCMDMAAVLCYDRKADTVTVMQMPVATYIGEDGSYATSTYGNVWGHPKDLSWCDTCRCTVTSEDTADGNHSTCGTPLTTRAGSAFGDFIRVINTQYGLPIDNYLVIPRDGLVQLIDAVDGVDVALDATLSLDGIEYKKGVCTLTGKAAVSYAVDHAYDGTPDSDRARLLRQRQVFAGLFSRLSERKVDALYNTDPKKEDVLSNVMLGRNPVRYDTSSFGKARLMGVSESRGDGTKYVRALAEFLYDISHVDAENVTVFTLPGVSQKLGTGTVYSVNRAQTMELLQQYMNPYGLSLDEASVTVPQLNEKPQEVDAAVNTLDKLLVVAEESADK